MADKASLYLKWITLYNFVSFLRMEKYIEDDTCELMQDHLLSLKFLVDEDE